MVKSKYIIDSIHIPKLQNNRKYKENTKTIIKQQV